MNWQGIPVGSASITVHEGPVALGDQAQPRDCFVVTAKAKTGKVISIFYTLKHLSESTFLADSLAPISFYSAQTENSKTKSREVAFSPDGLIHSALWKQGKDTPEEEIDFKSENRTFDPISAAFLARSLPVGDDTVYTFDVFNGKHRFLITLSVVGREKIEVAGEQRESFKVVPTVKKLTDTEGEQRLRAATLWISADDKREVLKLKSEVLVGSVNAELERFIPGTGATAASARAALSTDPQIAHPKP